MIPSQAPKALQASGRDELTDIRQYATLSPCKKNTEMHTMRIKSTMVTNPVTRSSIVCVDLFVSERVLIRKFSWSSNLKPLSTVRCLSPTPRICSNRTNRCGCRRHLPRCSGSMSWISLPLEQQCHTMESLGTGRDDETRPRNSWAFSCPTLAAGPATR